MSSLRSRPLVAQLCVSLVLFAGCGGSGETAALQDAREPLSRAADGAPTTRTTLYFLADDGAAPIGVRRTVETVGPALGAGARGAVTALLEGPSAAERRAGVTSAIPETVRLLSLSLRGSWGEEAVVDVAGLPQATAGGVTRVRVLTQFIRTLIGVSGIQRMRLRSDGQPWGLWKMRGGVVDRAYTYDQLLGWYQVCTSVPGTEAVPGDCFMPLP